MELRGELSRLRDPRASLPRSLSYASQCRVWGEDPARLSPLHRGQRCLHGDTAGVSALRAAPVVVHDRAYELRRRHDLLDPRGILCLALPRRALPQRLRWLGA